MEAEDFDRVVRHVLPALNLDPEGFRAPSGFLKRARRRSRASALALTGVDRQLVHVGTLDSPDPEVAADLAVRLAVESLGAAAEACEQIVVAWADPDGRMCAAAFSLADEEAVPVLLGSSWAPPDSWPVPMIDATVSSGAVIETALDRVAQAVAGRGASVDFDSDLTRATRLVDLELLRRGGEGPIVADLPTATGDDAGWDTWLSRYVRSVRDEWRRAAGSSDDRFVHRESTSIEGPLAGMQVFLSYARPDAARLAWPTRDALHAGGATVWFDQEQSPDQGALDAGLADTIAGCDAYVMCASDEFVERAGYATQEIAWALRAHGPAARTRAFAVVAPAETVLPSVVAGWPFVALEGKDLSGRLASALREPPTAVPNLPLATAPVELPAPPSEADLRPCASGSHTCDGSTRSAPRA